MHHHKSNSKPVATRGANFFPKVGWSWLHYYSVSQEHPNVPKILEKSHLKFVTVQWFLH